MKLVRRISLFMTLSMIMLGLGGWGALKAEEFFYPRRYQNGIEQSGAAKYSYSAPVSQPADAAAAADEGGFDVTEQVIETASSDYAVVTADTVYLVEEVNLDDGTVTESEETIPVMYIGLNREELLEMLSSYEDNPPLTEQERGFETIELTAFSKDRVAVCKYYKEETPRGFYLMVQDHFIVVYEEDRSALFMNTDILLERLPDSLQREIMEGKFVAGEEELYLFLESYSS